MTVSNRRDFLRTAMAGAALSAFPASIARALAVPAARVTGTIKDVRHIVILMQENRSFDHYFGTMRGVRGFGDRHPIPMAGGRTVWQQSDGEREIPPFHLDTATTDALKVPGTPHNFSDAQAAWNQGRFGLWPKFKTPYSMGYYRRENIPFQFALAEAFTICDAYHCSVTTGTDPNRIVFWSGSNFNPELRARGENCTDADSEPNNLRCWVKGALPSPGYVYAGSSFRWPTIPDVLEAAGIDWRIYQDPNDNWTGAMHGGLAFESFRTARPGSGLYERGMSDWSLDQLARDVQQGTLPAVSWVLPPKEWSEHPGASTPLQGAEFTAKVLDALTSNPDVWSGTVFFQTFDENDGLFDHAPPPAPPSYDRQGRLAGAATLDLKGHYFHDAEGKYLDPRDDISGPVRPWGLGPRVPMYVVSPWSKGGWVNSELFDHTSVGRFIEKRFGVTIPGISPWHRAVCGDLSSAFDFSAEGDPSFPDLPDVRGASGVVLDHLQRPKIQPPANPEPLVQEKGIRPSRALPYILHVDARIDAKQRMVELHFVNAGGAGAIFQVYDRLNLDGIPRRYTVEAGKALTDRWEMSGDGAHDLWIIGPNGFVRAFKGSLAQAAAVPAIELRYDVPRRTILITATNPGATPAMLTIRSDHYGPASATMLAIPAGGRARHRWSAKDSQGWYDLAMAGDGIEHRYAGRMETGAHGITDPALG
ncbi:phospholipase C, phosphocholine-specific [Sphingomonas oleivorans]|uniref:phospholipase C n=1 Tax=Sphingomonas oleivorans TaxID=1735121 RepID=A0A2T5FV87_9SPHN|nr:phospholipase C, phosphocholine-specific [Sphingomonas oleivorans]PTQ08867.1 phospholipase C, phosphocholine-specific [Sphingomonas oleivorans]